MALVAPSGGAGRGALIDALEQLRQRYAGMAEGPQRERGATGARDRGVALPTGPAGPPLPPGVLTQTVGAAANGPWRDAVIDRQGAPGAGPLGPYNLAGDGGAWDASGVNIHNPLHARGDMAAPGPVGVGPGFWAMDDYGTPFWRRDWEHRPGQGWVIKGSSY